MEKEKLSKFALMIYTYMHMKLSSHIHHILLSHHPCWFFSRRQIDLNFNLLQGPIPEELYSLTNLRVLDLNDNELSGSISTRIGNLPRLSFFQVENNGMTGTVPSQMGELNLLEGAYRIVFAFENLILGTRLNTCSLLFPSLSFFGQLLHWITINLVAPCHAMP
jgi:hypothetical protein